jgi:hypothetical protein
MKSYIHAPIQLLLLWLTISIPFVSAATPYVVTISPLGNTSNVTGYVTIFTTTANTSLVGYAGIVYNVQSNLNAKTCNATNGCGVHIHNGTSCNNTSTQGGHYFNSSVVPMDPWINARYSSNADGVTNFNGIVNMGTNDIRGRVFIGTSLSSSDAMELLSCLCS